MPRVEAEVGSAANSYEILAKLATGGMAEIFLARGASTAGVERYVVLKRILKHRAADAAFVRMFLDEARLAAQLQHPNIAQVYDIGKLGDSYFFTMEYVHGETVRALLQRSHALRSPIPLASVLVIGAGAGAGLHHAHARNGFDGKPLGIVHRDVSPSNLMVSYEGGVKVVDFGVAKAAHRSQETRSGTVKGKISYLSPEQCRGGNIDRRSDLFSLGIVLWEMLTLERLFKRATDFEAMAAIVNEQIAPPSTRRPDVPRELDAIVLRLLDKDPDRRFQSADELHEAIESVAVRVGSALSSASLARYLRDLFGQRPEPWIEMQSRETHPEVFTVTSEPVPADLGIKPADELDLKLNAVPDLSAVTPPDAELGRAPSEGGVRTLPFRSADSDSSELGRPMLPTANMRVAGGDLATTLPYQMASPLPPSAPTMIHNDPSRPHRTSAPPPMPGSGPHVAPMNTAQSASYPSVANYPAYAPEPSYREDVAPLRRTPRFIYYIVGTVAIGIALGIVLALRGGTSNPPLKPPAVAEGSAEVPAVAAGSDVTAGSAVAPTGSAAVPSAGSAMAGSADAGSANGSDTGATNGSASVGSGATDGSALAGSGTTDGSAHVATPTGGSKPPKDATKKHPPPPREAPDDVLAKQIAATKYTDAVATCVANATLQTASVNACVIAACHTHDAAHAKRWLAGAGAKKAALVSACKTLGTSLESAPPKPDCAADPMACQH